jgi:hypothetical protein
VGTSAVTDLHLARCVEVAWLTTARALGLAAALRRLLSICPVQGLTVAPRNPFDHASARLGALIAAAIPTPTSSWTPATRRTGAKAGVGP